MEDAGRLVRTAREGRECADARLSATSRSWAYGSTSSSSGHPIEIARADYRGRLPLLTCTLCEVDARWVGV